MLNNEQKTRRNRLAPYTAADRRLKNVVVPETEVAVRHAARGLGRKSFARKAAK